MWYGLTVFLLLVSLFIGYRKTLSMDAHLDGHKEDDLG